MKLDKYVVYVDDDPDDRSLFMEAFHSIPDYRVVTLVNGFELMLFLKQRTKEDLPSLIVLDINMPVMNGIESLTLLKSNENYKDIPVVMFATSANPKDVEYCKSLNTEIYIKPRKYGEIRGIFQKLLKTLEPT
jgi:Chemotaxis response regulator containing a CheY-like receiver domain and a methylesterase domain